VVRGLLSLVLGAACLAAAPAVAQLGPFVGRSTWNTVASNGATGTITSDANFDGQPETYMAPAAIGPLGTAQLRASPSRQFLYARQTQPATGCSVGQHKIFYYRFEPQTSTTGNLVPVMEGQFCIAPSLPAHDGLFENPGVKVRTAYIAELAPSGTQQTLFLVNLDGLNAWDSVIMNRSIEPFLSFAPEGQVALVRHDTNPGASDPTRADHSLIDLCPPPRLGMPISGDPQTVSALSNLLQPPASAAMIEPSPGQLAVRVTHPDLGTTGELDFPFTDCEGVEPPPPPPLERLRVTVSGAGSVSSNPAGIECSTLTNDCEEYYAPDTLVTLTAGWTFPTVFAGWGGDCSSFGTGFQATVTLDAARNCTATFGSYELALQLQAPAAVPLGSTITYTLSYENTGTLAVTGVVVRNTVPSGTSFVSATAGGAHDQNAVSWDIGALAPGASGQVSYTVTTQTAAGCGAFQIVNHAYSIDSDQTNLLAGSPSIFTQLQATSTAPISISVVSTPANPALRGGDLVTHAVTLTNTLAEPRACVFVRTLAGQASHWDSVIDAAGGTVYTSTSPLLWTWVGDLGPNETLTFRWATRVDDCIPPTQTFTRLNGDFGQIFVNLGNSIVGFGPTQQFPLAQSASSSIRIEEGTAPQSTGAGGPFVQAVRGPAPLTVELRIENELDAPLVGASASFQFPPGLAPRGNPPFAETPPAGTGWDPLTSTVSWAGDLAPQQVLTIRVTVDLLGDSCSLTLLLAAATATCPIDSSVQVLDVRPAPAGAHLLALGRYDGIFAWELGVDTGFEPLMCLGGFYNAMAFDPARGEAWVMSSSAAFRLRFEPLELEFVDAATRSALGVGLSPGPVAAALDPRDGTFVLAVDNFGASSLRRFNPQTRLSSNIASGLPHFEGLAVAADGTILGNAAGSGLRVNTPSSPAVFQTLVDPDWDHMGQGIAAAPSGWFIAPLDTVASTQDLVRVDPVSKAFAIDELDLGIQTGVTLTPPPFGPFFAELALAPDGTLYTATNQQIGLLTRSPAGAVSFAPSLPSGSPAMAVLESMVYVPGTGAPDRDGDGVPDAGDVCPDQPDPAQADVDGNGRGNACECGDQTGDGRVDVRDLVGINVAIFTPAQATPLCDTNDDALCDVRDLVGVNIRIFGGPAYCAAYPAP
jgi:uncharacterized repeat protein (TIGR01451 family)